MKIAVLIKYVPEATATWRFADDRTLDREGVEGRLSELDEYAVEQAVRLVEAGAATEISYLTMGPARAVDGLRKALAMGGDRAVHVLDDAIHGSDAVGTSLVLAAALRRMGFDLVICGMASTDAEMSVVPVMVADRLGVPAVVNAAALRVGRLHRHRPSATPTTRPRRSSRRCPHWCRSPTGPARPGTRRSRESSPPRRSRSPPGRWRTWRSPADRVGAGGAATEVRAVRPRPPREAGTVITDEGDAAAQLADFLAANKLL